MLTCSQCFHAYHTMVAGLLVAVKVRHPNVSEVIERDFGLMMSAAKVGGREYVQQNFRWDAARKAGMTKRMKMRMKMSAALGCTLR